MLLKGQAVVYRSLGLEVVVEEPKRKVGAKER